VTTPSDRFLRARSRNVFTSERNGFEGELALGDVLLIGLSWPLGYSIKVVGRGRPCQMERGVVFGGRDYLVLDAGRGSIGSLPRQDCGFNSLDRRHLGGALGF
jgi:hypothetical protein